MKCEHGNCQNLAIIYCEWGLYEEGGLTITEKKNGKDIIIKIIDATPRSEPMNEAKLCNDCSNLLWLKCAGSVNSGNMHWINKGLE